MNRLSLHWGAACASVMLLTGCHKKSGESPASGPLPVARIHEAVVTAKTYTATEEVTGTVRSKNRASIEAKVSGRIDKMLVTVGQLVKAGDLLVELDAREIHARLDQAKAVLEQSLQDRKRIEALLQQKAVTQQEFDATLARARVAEASASEAETMLSYTKIAAPFAGVVTRKMADFGDIAIPGRPLLELEDPASLRLESDFPEALIDRIRLGEKLSVRLANLTNDLESSVSEISPLADASSRTFRVKVDLPPATPARLGQFGRVAVPIGDITTLRVPAKAVVVRGQMELVYTVTNHVAQLRLVKTGKQFPEGIEILAGLRAGERLVLDEAGTLVDGQPVEVMQ